MLGRVGAEATAAWRSFLRRRTAVFFTFFFPVILVVIFGALVRTQPGSGLFAEPPAFYVPGYLATVVLFTPLSRIGSEMARHRDGHRFEKLATTPLSRVEWLAAHTLVNAAIIGVAGLLILLLTILLTGAGVPVRPLLWMLGPFVLTGTILFCGMGAVLGRVAESQDGVIAAANGIALPLLFLSDTFVPTTLLPAWFVPVVTLSPLTYFARGVRAVVYEPPRIQVVEAAPTATELALANFVILSLLAVAFFAVGAYAVPRTD